jgi:micrococcal nuclease
MYEYKAFVTKVYDGDTITVDIELGFGIVTRKQKIRLADINTPEVRGEEREAGLISRDVLREKILHKNIIITTFKDKKGKYGRYIGIIYLEEFQLTEGDEVVAGVTNKVNINNWLVENNYAEYKVY